MLAFGLLLVAIASAVGEHNQARERLDRALRSEAEDHAQQIERGFSHARSLTLITANNPAFRRLYARPGGGRAGARRGGRTLREASAALAYLERLFPDGIGEAGLVDRGGAERARAVEGRLQPRSWLSRDETGAPFFRPAFALERGEVHQGRPYRSPDTHEWVIPNATPLVLPDGSKPAIVHFETKVESLRRDAAKDAGGSYRLTIVDAVRGELIVDSTHRQPAGEHAGLGRPRDRRFVPYAEAGIAAFRDLVVDVAGSRSAFHRVRLTENNANDWFVVATSVRPLPSWIEAFGLTHLAMIGLGLLLLGFAVLTFRSSQAELRSAALTDPLTGLGNRRRMMIELEERLETATEQRPLMLGLFDLDGFKGYNDNFGHPAGDALLVRLAARLEAATDGYGSVYRMGGDEFCVLAHAVDGTGRRVLQAAGEALSERGKGFVVTASHGSVLLPTDTRDPAEALRAADQRMYASKSSRRASAGRQTTDVLLRVLAERHPDIGEHLDDVTLLCEAVADRLGLVGEEKATVVRAAALHDVGKAAIPDAIVRKPGPLDDQEWEFMRQHTVIGERILAAAPALAGAAKLVRWSHERIDGAGYPDGLAGDQIPLGARVIAVCDAFDAMTTKRPYRPEPLSREEAIAELRRSSGDQFDAEVVEAFCATLAALEPVLKPELT